MYNVECTDAAALIPHKHPKDIVTIKCASMANLISASDEALSSLATTKLINNRQTH